MAKYVRPRLLVEAVKLDPKIAEKLGYTGGAYLINEPQEQYVQGVNEFEKEFRLVTRKVPTPRPTRVPRPRKSRARTALGHSLSSPHGAEGHAGTQSA